MFDLIDKGKLNEHHTTPEKQKKGNGCVPEEKKKKRKANPNCISLTRCWVFSV